MLLGEYLHNKTGNTYTVIGLAFSRFQDTEEIPNFHHVIAHCSENKDVEVKVYKRGNIFWYVSDSEPALFENTKTKVLYERNGVYWLRSVTDFEKPVDINGILTPRFSFKDKLLKTSV